MGAFMITFGLHLNLDLGDEADADLAHRNRTIYEAAFSLGPAWHGGQRAVFLRSDLGIDDIVARLTPLIGSSDCLLVVELGSGWAARHAGWLVDAEGFEAVLPEAIETPLSGLA
jgi:hypothetical protein